MASESSRGHQNQQLDNLISCAICLGYFVDPRILPCSHTYCLECIHKTASSNRGEFECPMRDGTKVGKNHIDSLPINRAIRDMVDVLPNMINRSEQNREACEYICILLRFNESFLRSHRNLINLISFQSDITCRVCLGLD
jgi:hypothetical protein